MNFSDWSPPPSTSRTIELGSGNAKFIASHGLNTLETKARVFGMVYRKPDGSPHKVKVKLPSTTVKLRMSDGTVLQGRSFCKPPDKFDARIGMRLALQHLVRNDTDEALSHYDRQALFQKLLPILGRPKAKSKL